MIPDRPGRSSGGPDRLARLFHPEEARHPSGHAASHYVSLSPPPAGPVRLDGSTSCDVCVVGGGLTGLSSALHLAERGFDVVLLEARRLGWGASGRNGGQLLTGQRLSQLSLEAQFGVDTARALWILAEDAKASVRKRIDRHAIACDLRPGAFQAAAKPSHFTDIAREAEHLAKAYGYGETEVIEPKDVGSIVASPTYHGGIWDAGAGHLNPLAYAQGLARAAVEAGARLFEDSPALSFTPEGPVVVTTARGDVQARALILACNGYQTGLAPDLEAHVLAIHSFVGVTRPLPEETARALLPRGGCVADTRMVLDYYRLTPDHRLLFGGGESWGLTLPKRIAPILERRIARVFPGLGPVGLEQAWGGRLGITLSRMPHFARFGADRFAAQGFSGQGLAITTQAGAILAEALAGQLERFDIYARAAPPPLPGGRTFRAPLMVLAMTWALLKDAL